MNDTSPWPHRFAVGLVLLSWPMIWVGGLVTTLDAGMSVPDWPGTYGYNLWLYPLSTWWSGPFDLFIEHGHRLLGTVIGLVAIGFVVSTFWTEPRRWVKAFSIFVLIAVIAQGVLGGLRVVLGEQTLAMIHGATAAAFLCVCVIAACVTGTRWNQDNVAGFTGIPSNETDSGRNSRRPSLMLPIALVAIGYTQWLLGANLRHALPTASAAGFGHTATTHVTTALIFWAVSGIAWWRISRCGDLTLSRPATGLVCLGGIQIGLGLATWVVKYGFPAMIQDSPLVGRLLDTDALILQSKNVVDAAIVTSHVGTGSLILAVATMLVVRVARRRRVSTEIRMDGA